MPDQILEIKSPSIGDNAAVADEPRSFGSADITTRQLEILAWVAAGKSSLDIGGILGISGRTVEDHLDKVFDRLGVRSRIQAVIRVKEMGLPLPPTP